MREIEERKKNANFVIYISFFFKKQIEYKFAYGEKKKVCINKMSATM